jgi:hypothetical protein
MPSSRLLFAPLVLCSALTQAAPGTTDWNAAAQQDMRFAIDTIGSSHAGAVRGQLDVTTALQSGGRSGMIEAANVKTEQDYRRAMVRFIDGFGDPHTGIDLRLKIQAWTGIVLDRVDGQYRVIWSESNWPQALPPRDATVQSCDGVWIGTYLKTSVAPFIDHSTEYPTTFSEAARQSMFDSGLGWTPRQCTFTLVNGSSRQYDLPLRAVADGIGDERITQVRKQYAAKGRPAGLYPLAAGMNWVAMPDFNGRLSAAAYEKLYPQLAALKNSDWVVFDLRGNGGGDSTWGNRALQALYGKEYGERLGDTAAYSKLMIADQATVDLYQRYVGLPEFAASKGDFEDVLHKLETAHRGGEKMAQVEGGTREQAAALAAQLRRRPGGPRVAAVIDRGCFSSCMNFVQQIGSMADTVLLGESTLGYSPYGEINQFKLPSGNGKLHLPSAIYTAFQATREPFVPDLPYPGNMADEPALMKWVADTLAKLKPGLKH